MGAGSSRFSLLTVEVLLASLWLGGCGGPPSITSLRQHPSRAYSFEVPAACETVFQRIARRAQERYRYTNLATYQPGVIAQLAPDHQSASVTFFDAGGIGLRYVQTADLRALDSTRTQVRIYLAKSVSAPEAVLWQHWAITPLDETLRRPRLPSKENDLQDVNDLKDGSSQSGEALRIE